MIYRNKNGYPASVDDTMDSAVRISILNLADDCSFEDKVRLSNYERNGMLMRCPEGSPADNVNNSTLDQARMLIMIFYVRGYRDKLRRIWWAYFKRGFFGQNIERDKPGSKKYPWPHWFYKDSEPTSTTWSFYDKGGPSQTLNSIEYKSFDWRDPSGPDFWWVLTFAAKMYWFYPVAIIGYPLHLLRLKRKREGEFNQTIADCIVLGTCKKLHKAWNPENFDYWAKRNEIEYAQIMQKAVRARQ